MKESLIHRTDDDDDVVSIRHRQELSEDRNKISGIRHNRYLSDERKT